MSLGLQGQCVNWSADLLPEDLVDETVLFNAATTCEGGGGDRRTEVVAASRVVLDLGVGARDGGLDAFLDLLGRGHDSLA
jgi:hypothetical protein